jgi:hypothetical protein
LATVIADTRATTNFSSNRIKLDFADGIALLDPNANPFTLITQKLNRGSSGAIKHSWLEDVLQPESGQVTAEEAASETTLAVDDALVYAVGDLVMHNQTNEIMLVTASTTTTILVDRDYGEAGTPGYTALADTIDDNDYLTIIGNAFEQGAVLPTEKSVVETERYNYCQDVRTPFGVTEIAAAANVYGENDWTWQMKKAGITHQRKLEAGALWGVPEIGVSTLSAGVDTGPPTSGGIRWFLNEYASAARKVSQAEITMTEFLDFLEAGFEYGSAEKVMFCSPVLRTALDYWGITKLNTFSEKNVFGMKVATWVSAHGTVKFVTHKMLKDPGSDGAWNFLLDMENIKWVDYANIGSTRLRHLDVYQATGETSKKAEYQTIGCMEFKLPETHAYLKGVTSYAA